MPKLPSEATQLRSVKQELRKAYEKLRETEIERAAYRARATKAEQEANEWKARFDLLLSRVEKQ